MWNKSLALEPRFIAKFQVNTENQCWEWTGAKCKGYGVIKVGGRKGRNVTAHRASYLTHRGELYPGLEVDHLCKNRGCVNPDHLELVTHKENCLRADGSPALNHRKTHCKHGHELNEKNTYIQTTYANPRRLCRPCRSRNQVAYEKRKRSHYQGQIGVTGSRL